MPVVCCTAETARPPSRTPKLKTLSPFLLGILAHARSRWRANVFISLFAAQSAGRETRDRSQTADQRGSCSRNGRPVGRDVSSTARQCNAPVTGARTRASVRIVARVSAHTCDVPAAHSPHRSPGPGQMRYYKCVFVCWRVSARVRACDGCQQMQSTACGDEGCCCCQSLQPNSRLWLCAIPPTSGYQRVSSRGGIYF